MSTPLRSAAKRRPARSPSPAAANPAASGDASRLRILDAAESLMASRGYSSTGIAAISKKSGLPPSSIYWHFESKQGLLAAVVERSAGAFIGELATVLATPTRPRAKLSAFADFTVARAAEEQPVFMRLLILLALDAEQIEHPLSERLETLREDGIALLRGVLAQIYRENRVQSAEAVADAAALFALSFVHGSYVLRRIGPERLDATVSARQLEAALLAFPFAARPEPSAAATSPTGHGS